MTNTRETPLWWGMQKSTKTSRKPPSFDIDVKATYLPDQSQPERQHYFFSYTVKITNKGKERAQLTDRHWIITDGFGQVNEVKGPGVVGQQPHIEPGESFEYSSFCPLPTPTGSMRGFYKMSLDNGDSFNTEIPTFYLVEPHSYH